MPSILKKQWQIINTLFGGLWDCVMDVLFIPFGACVRFRSSQSSSRASSALMTSSSSSCGFLRRSAKRMAMIITLSGWLIKISWNMDTNMETSHSSCCLLSNWSPYRSVKNPAAAAVERQTNHPMYTNHHGNIHLNLLFIFVFTGDFSGETKRSVDSMEFLPFDGPGETKKTAIAKIVIV